MVKYNDINNNNNNVIVLCDRPGECNPEKDCCR